MPQSDPGRVMTVVHALAMQVTRPSPSRIQDDATQALDLIQDLGAQVNELRGLVENMTREPEAEVFVALKLENARLRRALAKTVDLVENALNSVTDEVEGAGLRA